MSCITEILKMKGDADFLPVPRATYSDVVVEGGGNYKGYEYIITFTDNGFRCGYVAVPESHPCHKNNTDYPSYSVHGGVTFFEESHLSQSLLGHRCTDKWLGFDAGHSCDIHDLEASLKYFPNLNPVKREYIEEMNRIMGMGHYSYVKLRNKEYMVYQCKQLIDQLIEEEIE